MKRLTPELRERLRRNAEASFHKRLVRAGLGRLYGESVRSQNRYVGPRKLPYKTQVITRRVSGRLDMLNDPDHTLTQLTSIEYVPRTRLTTRVHIILDDVTYIDAPSLLFLCSRIRLLRWRYSAYVTGSWPNSPEALKTLQGANFAGFLQGHRPKFDGSTRTLLFGS